MVAFNRCHRAVVGGKGNRVQQMESKIQELQNQNELARKNEDQLRAEVGLLIKQRESLVVENRAAAAKNQKLRGSADRLKKEQEKNQQNVKKLRKDYENKLESERQKMSESMEQLQNSYASTENLSQKRTVLVQDVTDDSRDGDLINDTLTDELEASGELAGAPASPAKKGGKRAKKKRNQKQYLNNSNNESQASLNHSGQSRNYN